MEEELWWRAVQAHAGRWAPYRAYAVQHLWAVGDHAINHLPIGART
ncbi:MAG: hypothetical protein ACR2K2_05450 [Mycobacteriales bacterium]